MKTANKRIEIRMPEIHELGILGALHPRPRSVKRQLLRARELVGMAAYWLFKAPRLVREQAPGLRPLEEYEWRRPVNNRWAA